VHGRALLITPVLALALAAPAWADDLPVLARQVHMSTDQPGYVRVTVPKAFDTGESDSNGKPIWHVHVTIRGGSLYRSVMLRSEFVDEALPGTPNGPMIGHAFEAGGNADTPEANYTPNGGSKITPGTYRLYLISAPGVPVAADITIDPLDGSQSLTPTTLLPAEQKTMTTHTGADGRSVAGAFIHLNSYGLLWRTRSWSRGDTQVGQAGLCDYGPGAHADQPDAFDAGCPGGRGAGGDMTPGPPLAAPGSRNVGTDWQTQSGGDYGFGLNEWVANGPPGQVGGTVLAIPYELPDAAFGTDVFGRPTSNQAQPNPSPSPAPTPTGVVTAAGQAASLGTAAVVTIICGTHAACIGRARLGAGTPVRFSLAAGARAALRVPLTSTAQRTLARRGRLRATLQLYGRGVRDTRRAVTIRARRTR